MNESLGKSILKITETGQQKNVKDLVLLVRSQFATGLEGIKRVVKNLQQRRLTVIEEPKTPANRYTAFLSSRKNLWLWVVIGLTLLALVSILFFPESGTPLSYARYAFGFVLAVFLPGYCLTKALFPRNNSMDEIERFTFSVGLSFAVTALTGLFLSFSPFGLTLTTTLLTLSSIVIILSLIALKRNAE